MLYQTFRMPIKMLLRQKMMKIHWLKQTIARLQRFSRRRNAGFTLIELLAVTLIGSIVTSSLLYIMVDLLRDNQRENAMSETQQDMRRALDYISQDLREAVYVYTGNQLAAIKDNLPDFGTGVQPILAFWKVEQVPYTSTQSLPSNCSTAFNSVPNKEVKVQECNDLKIERRTYTLVVYLQSTADKDTWNGQSRIERYQLRKYSDVNALTQSVGYVDPRKQSSFEDWPKKLQEKRPIASSKVALVDFVDDPKNDPTGGKLPQCGDGYERTPSDDLSKPDDDANSFFACVRVPDNDLVYNQDVILVLRGNAYSKQRAGYISSQSYLPVLQAQVINRGVVDKRVNN